MCTGLAQAVSITTAATTSQAGGGTQTPAARTPEQVVQGLQTPGAPPAQPVAPVQDYMVLVMLDDKQHRLERFGRLQPPTFSRTEGEDAQGFLDKCWRILRTTGILETSGVAFTAFQFSGAALTWWESYERRRTVDAVPLTWQQFSIHFLEKYVPQSRREELHNREKIRRFVNVLTYQLRILMTRERVSSATFEKVDDIAREIELVRCQKRDEREAKRPRGSGSFGGVPSRGQFQHRRGCSFRHAQSTLPVHRGASSGHGSHNSHQGHSSLSALPAQSSSRAPSVQGSSMPGPSTGHSSARGSFQSLFPAPGSCYKWGEFGHMRRQCPHLLEGPSQ
ncbi:uncharacterized protein [Nicotiana sylvestris]|uniref:uncharacterized protein n=1 Tax=Nicotiana sylvestris TaxID=4096 RepID=UPI00388CEAB7